MELRLPFRFVKFALKLQGFARKINKINRSKANSSLHYTSTSFDTTDFVLEQIFENFENWTLGFVRCKFDKPEIVSQPERFRCEVVRSLKHYLCDFR